MCLPKYHIIRRVFLLLGFSHLITVGVAQRVNNVINSDIGLNNNEVTSIIQDNKGFMWFGTRAGLHKYNGYEIKLLRNNREEGDNLYSQSVEVLLNGRNNNLWIGTKSGGLASYDFSTGRLINYPNQKVSFKDFNGDYLLSLYEADDAHLYIGTWNGFEYFDKQSLQFTVLLTNCKTFDIKPDGKGGLWLGTNQGLVHYDTKTGTSKNYRFGYPSIDVASVCVDEKNNSLWLGTWRKGIIHYNYVTGKVTKYDISSMQDQLSSTADTYRVFMDSRGILWVGTWGGGLYRLPPGSDHFENVPLGEYRSKRTDDRIILTISEDISGLIWVGTDGAGIFKLDPARKKFNNITYDKESTQSIDNNHILGFSLDENNALWVGTRGGGLQYSADWNRFSKVVLRSANSAETGGLDIIKCVLNDKECMWVGAINGLYRIEKKAVRYAGEKNIILPPGAVSLFLKRSKITALLKDTGNTLWVGTQENFLIKIQETGQAKDPVITRYSPEKDAVKNAFQNERISCLFRDSRGRIWVGTYKGLYLYHASTDDFTGYFQVPGRSDGLSNNTILSLAEDDLGNIWAGTQSGLNKIIAVNGNSISVVRYTAADGLPSEYIHSVQPDHANRVWIGTNKGICCLDKNEIYVFDKRDGVCSNMFSENASLKTKDGTLFFGGFEGITYFTPDSIRISTFKPPLFFTSLRINNNLYEFGKEQGKNKMLLKPFYETEAITLNYKQNIFSIDFAALDYHATDKIEYQYILEGFMNEWISLGENRSVSYTNLRPGNYTLRIKATNSDKVWKEEGINLKIKILPPPWKTWWAYSVYLLVFTALLLYGRKLIQRQAYLKNKLLFEQKEREQENRVAVFKTKLFTNISHEFRTPLTLIIGPVDDLLRKSDLAQSTKKSLRMIHKQSRRLLRMINQLLDFHRMEAGSLQLNPSQGELVSFAREVFNMFTDEAIRRNMTYRFECTDKTIFNSFDADKLEIILYNLLSNAFKFTPDGGEIIMKLQKDASTCLITVKDNGTGISPGDLANIFDRFFREKKTDATNISGTGIGLSFVKDLVYLHKGEIRAESDGVNGSCFCFTLPLVAGQAAPGPSAPVIDISKFESK